jgi:hypothetical protein
LFGECPFWILYNLKLKHFLVISYSEGSLRQIPGYQIARAGKKMVGIGCYQWSWIHVEIVWNRPEDRELSCTA